MHHRAMLTEEVWGSIRFPLRSVWAPYLIRNTGGRNTPARWVGRRRARHGLPVQLGLLVIWTGLVWQD